MLYTRPPKRCSSTRKGIPPTRACTEPCRSNERPCTLPSIPPELCRSRTSCTVSSAPARSALVYRKFQPSTGLSLWIYSPRCVYEDGWDHVTTIARGLILHEENRTVVATPFPKFFNAGERLGSIPNLPFETFEKLDGSLMIVFRHEGKWRAATKGSFESEQARWAQARLDEGDLKPLIPGTTYLAEAVYPENRIVVSYPDAALVMLAAYTGDGLELSRKEVEDISAAIGWRAATRHAFTSVSDLLAHTATLPATEEGFVMRFVDGSRLKLKGSEYRRIHALISRCTPIAMWEALNAGDDMEAIRRDLPEEFLTDFDAIVGLLRNRVSQLEGRVAELAASVAHLSDKELGLALDTLPSEARQYLFIYRKMGKIAGAARDKLMRSIRPTGNELEGYVPSYAMGRVLDEAV